MLSTWPLLGPSAAFASRSTAITSATSDSIAWTTSPVEGRSSDDEREHAVA